MSKTTKSTGTTKNTTNPTPKTTPVVEIKKIEVKDLKEYTAAQLRKLKKDELIALATSLKIPTTVKDSDELRNKTHLLEDILVIHRTVRTRSRTPQMEITSEMQTIIDDKDSSKSDKIRKLQDLGMSTTQIASLTEAHYSFAHQVVTKYKYNKEKSIKLDDAQASATKTKEVVPAKEPVAKKKTTKKEPKKSKK